MAAASAAPFTINGAVKTQAFLEGSRVKETKALISELCRQFYHLGWESGPGGSITIKVHDDSIPKPHQLIVMCPSGVQKERMMEEDMHVLSPDRFLLSEPLPKSWLHKPPRCSDYGPLFLKAECYQYLFDAAIKLYQLGLNWSTQSHGPICSPNAVLARHRNAKVSAKAGTLPPNNGTEPSRCCIVLDIEGTTTPISFVTDVLFPYARDSVGKHLELTYDTAETQDDIKLLRAQVEEDLENGVAGAVPIPTDGEKEEIIAAVVANVEAMIKADRKITSLKQLQVKQTFFFKMTCPKEQCLTSLRFDCLQSRVISGELDIRVYIYSSGSRLAQRLLFGNTNYGDLRKYLCGFFDTTVGNKKETKSYIEITKSLGVDNPSEILFVTDVYQEATAAKAAGLEVIISIRPGMDLFQTIMALGQ
ncbi:UNVERIFIED_CONTAM: putative bifunctional methylthioribulose-1-phosphate dehydratase/enolase-phosphatase E1 1 [Sesamum radiatum]|uniref:Bifunctional methylthioribulose-1-phosphate dehydratase/enolase-phosphatase E1 1 n=1 Tax=Sesamum radiatum TaxID=300843 RepID=A0AAW2LR49_SESRA